MKHTLLLCLSFLFFTITSFAQMGIGTTTPDSSAMLDVYSTNKGFLPPRVALSATNVAEPIGKPATGLLVYNTATAGSGLTAVTPGYYYWNGAAWFSISNKGNAAGDMQYWNGSQWVDIPVGANGSALILCNGIPRWGGCPDSTITISPTNNSNEILAYSYTPNWSGNGDTQLTIGAWTVNGTPIYYRIFLKFDFAIPEGATISSAKLSFYSMPNPHGGNNVDAQYGSANAWYIQRITSAWTPANVTWNTQPATATTNQVTVPNSTSSSQNALDVDVTQLVKDMQQSGNNGFALRLITENYYNIRQYASSYYSDATKHPKLVITYKP